MVDVDGRSLTADSHPKLVGLVWMLAAIHQLNRVNSHFYLTITMVLHYFVSSKISNIRQKYGSDDSIMNIIVVLLLGRVAHIAYKRSVVTSRVPSSFCRSARWWRTHIVEKTAESIEMPFRVAVQVGSRNHVLVRGPYLLGQGAIFFWGGIWRCSITYRVNSASAMQKRLNWMSCRLGWWGGGPKELCIRSACTTTVRGCEWVCHQGWRRSLFPNLCIIIYNLRHRRSRCSRVKCMCWQTERQTVWWPDYRCIQFVFDDSLQPTINSLTYLFKQQIQHIQLSPDPVSANRLRLRCDVCLKIKSEKNQNCSAGLNSIQFNL